MKPRLDRDTYSSERICRVMRKTSLISILSLIVLSPWSRAADFVPVSLVKLGDGPYFSSTAITVDKSQRKLIVWEMVNGEYEKRAEFPSDLGKMDGPKIARGDKRTPEGVYFLEKVLEGPALNFQEYGVRAFTTNYPNLFDRRDGKTGDGIWLHAIPDQVSLERGSRGCVVVRNDAILSLSKFIRVGQTPIIISDNIKMAPSEKIKSRANMVSAFIESWRQAWANKNIESYISHYDDAFESLKMDRKQWMLFKQGLNEKYQSINVTLSQPVVLEYNGRIIVKTLQQYKSDLKEDFGEKVLYLEHKGDSLKIVAEEWAPVESKEAYQAMIPTRTTATPN